MVNQHGLHTTDSSAQLTEHEGRIQQGHVSFDNPGFRSDVGVFITSPTHTTGGVRDGIGYSNPKSITSHQAIPLQNLGPQNPRTDRDRPTTSRCITHERRRIELTHDEDQHQRHYPHSVQDIMDDDPSRNTRRRRARAADTKHAWLTTLCSCYAVMIVILIAAIVASTYVFCEYRWQITHPCPHPTVAIPPSIQEKQTMRRNYKNLKAEVDKLSEEVSFFLRSNKTQCQPTNVRDERRRFAALRRQVSSIGGKLRIIQTNLTNKINKVNERVEGVQNSLEELNVKISNVSEQQSSLGKCLYKTKSSPKETLSGNRTVSIVENDVENGKLIGVTCCSLSLPPNHNNHSSFLRATESQGHVTYTCRCINTRQCHVCYWECD